jgi:hypothetical protein
MGIFMYAGDQSVLPGRQNETGPSTRLSRGGVTSTMDCCSSALSVLGKTLAKRKIPTSKNTLKILAKRILFSP